MPKKTDREILEQKIEAWKNKLIDLSRRNRLLNFRTTKVTTIKIIDELPSEVFKSMVVESNSFHFLPKEEDTEELFKETGSTQINEQESEFHEYSIEELEEKHIDSNLQTNIINERLLKNLKRIKFRANQLWKNKVTTSFILHWECLNGMKQINQM